MQSQLDPALSQIWNDVMSTVLLIIQLIISVVLIGLILIQRSEGGALGIGGGGGGGGFMSGRSAANSVSRMTGILGAAFIVNSLLLSIVMNKQNQNISIIDETKAVESLTIDTESGETTNPLASDATPPAAVTETPETATTQDAAEPAEEEKPENE